jgi:hypothetical protein
MVGEREGVVLTDAKDVPVNQLMWIDLAVVKMWYQGDVVNQIEIKDDHGNTYKLSGKMVIL